MSGTRLHQRVEVAAERRHWVRLTHACNNRCAFCLDGDKSGHGHRTREEIVADLARGREAGATRLILSGGEPTIHRDYLDLVGAGRALGYRKVQTISNGRMFAYGKFARAALEAGLGEVTVSLHGHTAALHDALVGVAGAFEQATRGIRNLLADGRCHVSVDVVVNRQNVRDLPAILELAYGLGVREFDVLQITPFGFGESAAMRYGPDDPPGAAAAVARALRWADRPDVWLWTNRFPAAWLEGREHLLQDPQKLKDEVRGRQEWFAAWVAGGPPPPCRDERCTDCFLEGLCRTMDEALAALDGGRSATTRVDLAALGLPAARRAAARLPGGLGVLELRARDVAQAARFLESLAVRPDSVEVACARWPRDLGAAHEGLVAAAGSAGVAARTGEARVARRLAAGWPGPVVLVVTRSIVEWASERGWPGDAAARLPLRAELPEVLERDLDLALARLLVPDLPPVQDAPPCLGGRPEPDPLALELAALAAPVEQGLDLDAALAHHVRVRYRVKSFRCGGCRHHDSCSGVPVQRVRAWGLGRLEPEPAGEDDAGLCEFTVEQDAAHLVVRNPCRNACSFCTTAAMNRDLGPVWETDPVTRVRRTLAEIRARGVARLRFVAFELLDHPGWPSILLAARSLGLAPLEVWTHGRALADGLVVRALRGAGVDRLQVPVFGPTAEVHDRVAGSPGAFAETSAGLAEVARTSGLDLQLCVVLVPENLAALPELVDWARAEHPRATLAVILAEPSSPDPEAYRPLAVPWSAVAEVLAGAAKRTRRKLVKSLLAQVPPCVLHRAAPADYAEAWRRAAATAPALLAVGDGHGLDAKARVACPHAGRCAWGERCPGLFAQHLALFGDADLEPVP